jgi:DNA repair protein RecN (Recombination protein N)
MLQHLQIKNYALIQHLELNPDKSLNIITGETGAGKSIILGAIGLLLGNRMDTKALYNPDEKCYIEGHFGVETLGLKPIFDEEELDYEPVSIIRREISPMGKSRAFVNDTPVNLETLKKIGERLIDIHSQHDTTALASNEYQLLIIDSYAQNLTQIQDYKTVYAIYQKQKAALELIQKKAISNKKDFDYNNFLFDELSKVKIIDGELQQLEQELNVLENAEDLKMKLQLIAEYLYNAENSSIDYLEEAHSNMASIASFSANYLSLKQRLLTTIIELKDVFRETELALRNIEYDNSSIGSLQDRINVIYELFKKHSVKTEAELIEIESDLKQKVEAVLNLEDDLAKALKHEQIAAEKLQEQAVILSKSRLKVLNEIELKIGELLNDLGMPNASLKIDHKVEKASQAGIDLVNFLFSANKGIAPQQLKMVASGGEFSRLMLAIKYILADKKALPTIIFDEIDTGVSGEISKKVGKMINEMANNHQIIAITHLHQMAAQGKSHYFVYKDDSSDKTASKIKKLNQNERILEIAQMIGGLNPSNGVIENAKAILEMNN